MFWKNQKSKKENRLIELNEIGFKVTHNNRISLVEWSSIDKTIAYKVDLLTIDEMCIEIDYFDKRLLITEECKGWRVFLSELIIRIPTIDTEWEEKIIKPAFERNETELYNRNHCCPNINLIKSTV